MGFEYWKKTLKGKRLAVYQRIILAAKSFREEFELGDVSQDDVKAAFVGVLDDHPELFYISTMYEYLCKSSFLSKAYVMRLKFLFNKREILAYNTAIDKAKKELHPKIIATKNEEEREKIVCDYFIENFSYMIDNEYNQNAGTLFYKKVGQCSGISRGFKLIMDWIGIECLCVSGEATNRGRTESHEWNIIKINGKYYHVDVTSMISSNQKGQKPYFYCCFNYADSQMVDYKWKKSSVPSCVTETPNNTQSYNQTQPFTPIPLPNVNTNTNSWQQPINNSGLKLIKSMTEYREYVTKELQAGNRKISFESAIYAPDVNSLVKLIESSNRIIVSKIGISCSVRVSVRGNIIELEFMI